MDFTCVETQIGDGSKVDCEILDLDGAKGYPRVKIVPCEILRPVMSICLFFSRTISDDDLINKILTFLGFCPVLWS